MFVFMPKREKRKYCFINITNDSLEIIKWIKRSSDLMLFSITDTSFNLGQLFPYELIKNFNKKLIKKVLN